MSDERVERRLAAVLAADVAGYSRLMGADELNTLEALKAVRHTIFDPAVVEYKGRIVKTTGDGILVEFASAVDAITCANAVQDQMAARNRDAKPAINFRIGINVGDIIIDGDDIFGDGVNIASRLEGLADPGGIFISRTAYDQVRDKVSFDFIDLGERSLKNIARPVQAFRLARAQSAISLPRGSSGFEDTRAVAVLPFDNLSKDPDEEYFADGLTEDIITALSYWRWFPVVARNSTFAYKNKPKNVTDICKELGAAYLVEGSARRAADQIRITIQLIEAATGHHLYVERYDRSMTDVFLVQDEIAERICVSIEPEIARAEERRIARKHPSDLKAWDHALKALALQERMTPAGHVEARDQLALALQLEPTSARARSLLALCYYHEGILGWAEDRGRALQSSFDAAEQALAHDDREWLAHGLWGMGKLWTQRDFHSALEGEERAVALNPSAPLGRHFLACVLEFSGRPREALPHLQTLLRLDPHYRFRSLALADQSLCHFLLGEIDEAIATAEKGVRTHVGNVRARQRLVAALSARGLEERARVAAAELAKMQPTLDVHYIDDTYPFMLPDQRTRFVDALRAVGLLNA